MYFQYMYAGPRIRISGLGNLHELVREPV